MNQAAEFDMSIIGMPKKDRTGKGWIGFGSANAEPNDQGRQRAVEIQ